VRGDIWCTVRPYGNSAPTMLTYLSFFPILNIAGHDLKKRMRLWNFDAANFVIFARRS